MSTEAAGDPPSDLTLRRATVQDADRLAEVYLRSRDAAYPAMPRGIHPPAEVHDWVRGWDFDDWEVWLAEHGSGPIGYAVLTDAWLHSLYVDPDRAGHGIGSALLDLAKGLRPDGFSLWVFESNTPARRFYERHGLVALERTDGAGNEEHAPDLRMAWPGQHPLVFFRGMIDQVDAELGELLSRRVALTRAVQHVKASSADPVARDPGREAEIVAALALRVPELGPERLTRIVQAIITESVAAAAEPPG